MFRLLIPFAICFFVVGSEAPSREFAHGISHFSSDLYQECVKSASNANVIISPYSITSAVAFLAQASNGNTFEQIKKGLHLSSCKTMIANRYLNHSNALKSGAGDATFSIANQIYVQQDYEINEQFKEVAVQKFKSGVESVNFANRNVTAQTINHFVEEKTNGKIKNIIQPDSLTADSRFILVNAIHFKGEWLEKFANTETKKAKFYVSDMETVEVDLMKMTDKQFNYVRLPDLNAQALEMKYANSNFSMIFLLPNNRTGLTSLEAKINNYNFESIHNKMYECYVDVLIPKFNVEFQLKLNDVLQNLGMAEMFTDNADLSGLLKTADQSVKVSDVVHKAFITVSEGGTEAAATGIVTGIDRIITDSITFRADHPFMYYIWDNKSKTTVFVGRVLNFN